MELQHRKKYKFLHYEKEEIYYNSQSGGNKLKPVNILSIVFIQYIIVNEDFVREGLQSRV